MTSSLLIVWSNYYHDLARQQLESCLQQLKNHPYHYQLETVEAGTYELPAVIRYYQQQRPFDAYLPLGLLVKGATDHYDFIWQHVKECFIKFTLDGLFIGNGIISAPDMKTLEQRVHDGRRVEEAVNAVDYLLRLKNNCSRE